MKDILFMLRRGNAIEIITSGDGVAIPTLTAEMPVKVDDIIKYGRLLAFEEDLNPVFILQLPATRLPKPLEVAQTEKEKLEGKEPTFKLAPYLPDGQILTKATLKKAEDSNRLLAWNRPFLIHALTHAEGSVRLPRITTVPGGDGPLLQSVPAN